MTLALDHSMIQDTALKIATKATLNRLTADFDPGDDVAVKAHVQHFFDTYNAFALEIAEQNRKQPRDVPLR